MLKYYPYKSDKLGEKYYIITEAIKKSIVGLLVCLVLQFIKMNKGNKDILIGTKMVMKIGKNLA